VWQPSDLSALAALHHDERVGLLSHLPRSRSYRRRSRTRRTTCEVPASSRRSRRCESRRWCTRSRFTRVFSATYTSVYSQIHDWTELDKAAQVANRGQASGDGAAVAFKLFDYGDAEAPREVTVDVWRKIDLRTQALKLQSTSEWNSATGYPQAVAHEEDLAFTTHTLLPAEASASAAPIRNPIPPCHKTIWRIS
jgi:hypothetical protein